MDCEAARGAQKGQGHRHAVLADLVAFPPVLANERGLHLLNHHRCRLRPGRRCVLISIRTRSPVTSACLPRRRRRVVWGDVAVAEIDLDGGVDEERPHSRRTASRSPSQGQCPECRPDLLLLLQAQQQTEPFLDHRTLGAQPGGRERLPHQLVVNLDLRPRRYTLRPSSMGIVHRSHLAGSVSGPSAHDALLSRERASHSP